MSKVQSFDANNVMEFFKDAAPVLLLISAIISFLAIGIFQVDYYQKLLAQNFPTHCRSMAVMIATITEFVRFALLLSSIRDFSDKKPFNGWIGLLGSLALVFHEISVSRSMATMWSADNPTAYSTLFIFLILLGLGLEIRLILTVDYKSKKILHKSKNTLHSIQKNLDEKKSSNGVYHVEET